MDAYLNDSPENFDYTDPNANINPPLKASMANSMNMGMGMGNMGMNAHMDDDYYSGNLSLNVGQYTSPVLSGHNSYTSDPFLDDLDNLNFPQMNNIESIDQALETGYDNYREGKSYGDTSETVYNAGYSEPSFDFLNPRYFSPTSRNNFNSLNAIAEDDNVSQYGSSFKSIPESNYLSPNTKYLSPNYDSLDTLRSPSQSYLNSPPQYMSTSIPNPAAKEQNLLSPPNTSVQMSNSVPSGSSVSNSIPTKQLSKEEKLKRRREFHNAVERRRRDLIKERIKELGSIVPPSLLNPQLLAVQMLQKNKNSELDDLIANVKVKETKPNKSTILNKSVDYIVHLKYVLEEQRKTREMLEERIRGLEGGYDPPPAPTREWRREFDPDEFFSEIV